MSNGMAVLIWAIRYIETEEVEVEGGGEEEDENKRVESRR